MTEAPAGRPGDGPTITVFHLVWAPLGLEPLGSFLASYHAHQAGVPHRLHILFNGFASDETTQPHRALLSGIPHASTRLERPVQDLTAYLEGVRLVETRFVCFLNSYAEILASGWLAKLAEHAGRPSIGLVGATGSYESHLTRHIHAHSQSLPRLGRNALQWPSRARQYLAIRAQVREILRPYRASYAAFPNPHIRTNAFLIDRSLFLSMAGTEIRDKEDAFRFESGRQSLTGRTLGAGLGVLVIGRDGSGYGVEDWPTSRTFRSGEQENLLVGDNHTRFYDAAPPGTRLALAKSAWGPQAEAALAASRATSLLPGSSP